MHQFFLCNPLWTASFWIYGVVIAFALLLVALFVFKALKSRNERPFVIKTGPDGRSITLPSSFGYGVVAAAAFALVFVLPWIDRKIGLDVIPQRSKIEVPSGETLQAIIDEGQQYSSRTFVLKGRVGELFVQGKEFNGACPADLVDSICRRYGLRCDWPASEPVMNIASPAETTG